ncbi:MAG TPA: NAD(P)-dependent oxidoreductase [Nocardioidaceae bacterium]|nr:NAD(P)-dependent oxidoreductase [Nocardioidaceae bacterium]
MRVLVTGASGRIGSVLCPALSGDHEVRGLDIVAPHYDFPGELVVGDCSDPGVALDAVAGVDAVVHLAGYPSETDLPEILRGHVLATAALLEAMVTHGARRMVFASSNHAVGRTPRSPLLAVDTRPRPDTLYGVGKVAGEALLSLYADRGGIDAVAIRIGSFRPRPSTRRELSTWLSHDDGVRLFEAALSADVDGLAVIYGVSANRDGWWDLAPARALGYEPLDDAAAYETQIAAGPDDAAEAAYVGGPYANPDEAVPAFPASMDKEGR